MPIYVDADLYLFRCHSESAEQVIRGVNQACENEAFGEVLEYIFHLGNLLNFGDDTDYTTCVKSFSISSLAKLSQTKAYEGGTTFLQYVVQSIEVCCFTLCYRTRRAIYQYIYVCY